jgi:hypothetical protein
MFSESRKHLLGWEKPELTSMPTVHWHLLEVSQFGLVCDTDSDVVEVEQRTSSWSPSGAADGIPTAADLLKSDDAQADDACDHCDEEALASLRLAQLEADRKRFPFPPQPSDLMSKEYDDWCKACDKAEEKPGNS